MKKCIALLLAVILLLSGLPAANAEEPAKIVLDGKLQIAVGESAAWTVKTTPAEYASDVRWKSGYPAVATVDNNGVVTGHRVGDCNITVYTAGGLSATATVHVTPGSATGLQLAGKTKIKVGETVSWTAKPLPEGAAAKITWTAGNPGVATVDENGRITGHKNGNCHITASTSDGVKKTVTVHVRDVAELQLAGKTKINVGETVTWTAKQVPEDAETKITWSSGYPAVATIDENGVIKGLRAGDCHITATAENGVRKTVTLHVLEVKELQLSGKTSLAPNDTVEWTATPIPEGAETKITWTAGNPGVATVDENGKITAHKPGDCNITATAANGVKKTVLLHVMTPDEIELAHYYPDTLASYDSPHTAIAARTNNLILACRAIDGTILKPGEVFSFNKTVGQRTASKGYRAAIIFSGSGNTPALGGGVCQVASTIYLCTLLADLQVVERTEHMYAVTYVPPGMDATVYWKSLDYKFRNSTSHPLMIRASVSGGYVHIKLLGTKETNTTVKMTYTKSYGSVITYKNWYDASGKLIKTEKCAYSSYGGRGSSSSKKTKAKTAQKTTQKTAQKTASKSTQRAKKSGPR